MPKSGCAGKEGKKAIASPTVSSAEAAEKGGYAEVCRKSSIERPMFNSILNLFGEIR